LLFPIVAFCICEFILHRQVGIFREFVAMLLSLQLMLLVYIFIWCSCFLFLTFSLNDLPLIGLLLITIVAYFIVYAVSHPATDVITLLAGATLGKGSRLLLETDGRWQMERTHWKAKTFLMQNAEWNPEAKNQMGNRQSPIGNCLVGLIALLAFSSWWHLDVSADLYHGPRWMGLWNNPNIYGLLMSAGLLLAIGLLTQRQKEELRLKKLLPVALLVSTGMMTVGLILSYSRGAWLAVCTGGVYLLVQWFKRTSPHWRKTTYHYPLAIAISALLVVLFWQYRYAESAMAHRAISAFNHNDFSWRNRVAAWEGTLQMMAERPWLCMGWIRSESFYHHYYTASRVDETAAIQLNDYLMLGAMLGIPALLCFCMYLWLSLFPTNSGQWTVDSGQKEADQTMRALDWLKAVCRAGALVLAVGFWFDGGLFKLPTAATFWILLELGRVD
jgi:hypothetical protein